MSATTSINDYEAGRSAERGAILAELQRRIRGISEALDIIPGGWPELRGGGLALQSFEEWLEMRGE